MFDCKGLTNDVLLDYAERRLVRDARLAVDHGGLFGHHIVPALEPVP
jgi:hypothetical protein